MALEAQDGLRLCDIFPLPSRLHEVNLETENQNCSDGSASMWSFLSCTSTSNYLVKKYPSRMHKHVIEQCRTHVLPDFKLRLLHLVKLASSGGRNDVASMVTSW